MSGYIGSQPVPQATQTRQTFTATSGQTSFATIGYVAGGQFIQVYLNGVLLKLTDDYTAANGSDIVLTSGAATGDILEFITFADFTVNNQNFTGGLTVDNDGSTVLTVDRATSDGDICRFQKDGSSVGNISSKSGGVFIGNANGDVGIFFNGTADSIDPVNPGNGFNRDNAIDLGTSSARFKDLYLSGGVYLGGTGAANKLDYEETGTWTPVLEGATTTGAFTYSQQQGRYQKIGQLVHISFYVNVASVTTTPVGTVTISGLPYTSKNEDIYPSTSGAIGYAATGYSGKIYAYVNKNSTKILFGHVSDNSALDGADWGTHMNNTDAQIHLSLTYNAQ